MKMLFRLIIKIILLLMIIRTIIFLKWFLFSKIWEVDPKQYDWTLKITAFGWICVFLVFFYLADKEKGEGEKFFPKITALLFFEEINRLINKLKKKR